MKRVNIVGYKYKSQFLWSALMACVLGCTSKITLTERELQWINAYNQGDTLIFRSSNNELDTTFIVKKEIHYLQRHGFEFDEPSPVSAIVWYKNKCLQYHPDGYSLISLYKSHPDSAVASIDYLYSGFIIMNTAKDLYSNPNDEIYEFNTFHPEAPAWRPKRLFWHRTEGLIKYVTKDSVVWTKLD